ncbi:MAG: hypothetical protein CVU44_09665 [Chloroflexi bacterium HGW-Chloroflexi-6]|nr:MAG: hypothetical protein CVU44_09665 [Chloroflexi bacterium HGW-Chloroflexi-6]
MYALYHLIRADFLERIRRYSFLIMLGLVVWLGYASASQQIILRVPPDYVGEINSHWIGALMAMTATLFLGWFGFYLVKGSVARDYETGVGQIMATTPLTRPLYTLGKWLSNFAVLGVMLIILLAAGVLMNLLVGASLDLWALAAPTLLIALPCMVLIAALAVLFETISWLRGGLGNVVYFFVFMLGLIPSIESKTYQPLLDFAGFRLIGDQIARAAKSAYPESQGGFAFSITSGIEPRYFPYDGLAWTSEIVLYRLFFILMALGLVLLAALFFDRFNPSHLSRTKKREASAPQPVAVIEAKPVPNLHLTPLASAQSRFRFDALLVAELKLFLKGQRWWWYAIASGLIAAQLLNDLDTTRLMLAVAWAWPILILSGLGCREARHDTRQIVFCAPRPLLNQLPALWLSAFAVLALLGSGAFIRFLAAGEFTSLLAWLAGALFIPSLALALGVLTGSGKTFEVVYVLWMYGVLQRVPAFDFVGTTPSSPWHIYALLALVLMVIGVLARQGQLKSR